MGAPKGELDRGQCSWRERGCGGSRLDYFCARALVGDGKARGQGSGVQPADKVTAEGGERAAGLEA